MIPCECCQHKPATIHLTDIRGDVKREIHLCAECAKKKGFSAGAALQLPQLLGAIAQSGAKTPPRRATRRRSDNPACPHCGIRWSEFRERGRLGCPGDYDVFRSRLARMIDQYHDDTRHVGRRPPGAPAAADEDEIGTGVVDDAGPAVNPPAAPSVPGVPDVHLLAQAVKNAHQIGDSAPEWLRAMIDQAADLAARMTAGILDKHQNDAGAPETPGAPGLDEWRNLLEKLQRQSAQHGAEAKSPMLLMAREFLERKISELEKSAGQNPDSPPASAPAPTPAEPAESSPAGKMKPGKIRRAQLEKRLARAVSEERYEEAARLRDKLRRLDAAAAPAPETREPS